MKLGRKHTEESKKKISEKMRGKKAWNKDLKGFNKGHKNYLINHSEETKRKISETMKRKGLTFPNLKGHKWTDEQNKKRSKRLIGHEYHGDFFEAAQLSLIKLKKVKRSKAEFIVEKYLKNRKIKFKTQYKYSLGIADFYLLEKNLIIECNGNYWHSKPEVKERNKQQYKWVKENNYNLLIISSEDIVKNKIDLNKII